MANTASQHCAAPCDQVKLKLYSFHSLYSLNLMCYCGAAGLCQCHSSVTKMPSTRPNCIKMHLACLLATELPTIHTVVINDTARDGQNAECCPQVCPLLEQEARDAAAAEEASKKAGAAKSASTKFQCASNPHGRSTVAHANHAGHPCMASTPRYLYLLKAVRKSSCTQWHTYVQGQEGGNL